jgi:hypothetical protein
MRNTDLPEDGIADMNLLYDAFQASMKGSSWKGEPQGFEADFLSELTKLSDELLDKTYRTSKGSEFVLKERGKERYIHGNRMRDRVARHCICDNVLTPTLSKYLIYNNGASQKGKGIDFSRKIFERDLHNYWLEHRSNEGYIAFMDLSKFFDNIVHEEALRRIKPKIDEQSQWLIEVIFDNFKVDVSYMSDEEYQSCMKKKFNSIEYHKNVPEELKTGKKFMRKSVDIGDQVSQDVGTFFPTDVDNYATIVRGCRRYGRYMDDIYIIHEDREFLKSVIAGIEKIADEMGMFVNKKKTRLVKLSTTYTYLQFKYSLSNTGKVIKRINPKSVTRERRKLKKYKHLLDRGTLSYSEIEQCYKSWICDYAKYMSKVQREHMQALYEELFGRRIRWKQ